MDMLNVMKNWLIRALTGPSFFRRLAGFGSLLLGRTLPVDHLVIFREEDAIGPLQREEALFLLALVRVVRPRVIVEFGFGSGHSALNFLAALPTDGRLYSFDVSERAALIARERFGHSKRFKFIPKSQEDFNPRDVDGHAVDLLFMDASHDFELNRQTFEKTLPLLVPDAFVVVHDTGTWRKECFLPAHADWARHHPEGWLDSSRFQPHPAERKFVNWLRREHPAFAQLHLHSERTIRQGLTVLQRSRELPVAPS